MHRRKKNSGKRKSGTAQVHSSTFCFYPVTVTSYVGMIQIRYTGPGGFQPALSLFPQAPRYLRSSILFTGITIPLQVTICQAANL